MTDYQFYMLLATAAGPVVELVVGGAQCLLIFRGLRQMEAASRARERLHAQTMTAMKSRHSQIMTAHEEKMAAIERRHVENMAALQELIRRTGGGNE